MEFVKLVGPFAIFFIMYSLGLKLTFVNFYDLLRSPKNLIVGLICQLIFLPIIGLLIVSFYPMPNELKIGILLLLLLPSATMSNYATRLVDGNVSLSIALTTVCSLLCIVTIPVGMVVLFELVMHEPIQNFDVKEVSIKIFIIITIPTIFGIITNHFFNYFKERIVLLFDKISMLFFLFIISIAVYQERLNLGGYFEYVGIIAPIILFFVLLVAVIFTKYFVDGIDAQRSITVECLLQNGAMGFIVSAQIFADIAYVTPIALYALLQYFVLAFYIANIKIVK
jgi:BASS family bile acid:Na+ symporter